MKYVPCACKSNGTAARKTPVTPPMVKSAMKPIENSIAVENLSTPPNSVVVHEKIFTPVGMAMSIVSTMNGSCSDGAMPEVNMWCAQTMKPRIAMAHDENAIIL